MTVETALLIILIILMIIVIITLVSKKDNDDIKDLIERLGRLELNLNKDMTEFKGTLSRNLSEDFDKLNINVERRLLAIDERVNSKLDENFAKSNKLFINITSRLATIDEAQKKIDSLSTDIVSLQGVLTDKKSRGIFGEVNLRQILSSVFGEKNDNLYKMQYTLSTGDIVDAILFAPSPLGKIGIDSKFPLENYQRMVDKSLSPFEREKATREFKSDFKKHINAIKEKYIIPGETSDQAILFLPAEAIFAEVNAYHPDLLEHGARNKVWITSPTTLMSTLTVIQMIVKNIERDKYTSIIHEQLNFLGENFRRYKDRWAKLCRSINSVTKDVKEINASTGKISKSFDKIYSVELKDIKGESGNQALLEESDDEDNDFFEESETI